MEVKNMDKDASENFCLEDDDHSRCLVHIDIDCFYAQVEMLKNPELRTVPLGIQQKNILVTSNYEARKYGVKKCMLISDAFKLCPSLKLVKGEDLHDYRVTANKIFALLQTFKCSVEKLGMDENFLDVTGLVAERLSKVKEPVLSGHQFCESLKPLCHCGCIVRLKMASQIANEVRNKIFCDLGITTCAGIAHNKLLAKLVCTTHKPNDQTTIYPEHAIQLMTTLSNVNSIPGIGTKTAETLQNLGIKTVIDLQEATVAELKKCFSGDMSVRLKELSLGIDKSIVKQSSARPSSIGLEDSFKTVSLLSEVEEKFSTLLDRLAALVREDGRIPVTLRVTLRKKDDRRLSSHRESRQIPVPPAVFTMREGVVVLTETGHEKLLNIIMRLFNKLIDLKKPFHLTLVGLAFTKFRERMIGRSSIVNYFMNDLSVQSVLSLQNECDSQSVCSMDLSVASPTGSTTTDLSDCEVEPSPKKVKRVNWIAKKRCLSKEEIASPSKLKVSDLRLNSKELEKVSELRLNSREREPQPGNSNGTSQIRPTSPLALNCPSYVDQTVFNELPEDVQEELKIMWKNTKDHSASLKTAIGTSKPNTILRYFIPNK